MGIRAKVNIHNGVDMKRLYVLLYAPKNVRNIYSFSCDSLSQEVCPLMLSNKFSIFQKQNFLSPNTIGKKIYRNIK